MDLIKVSKVDDVRLLYQGSQKTGSLHISQYHLIFKHPLPKQHQEDGKHLEKESWITYPNIWTVKREYLGSTGIDTISRASSELSLNTLPDGTTKLPRRQQALAIRLRCRDFTFLTFCFEKEKDAKDVYDSIKDLTCRDSVEKLYAFSFNPGKTEKQFNGWDLYNVDREFARQGITPNWRLSQINNNFGLCSTYPRQFYVPKSISDTTLGHASKYRSKERIPVLTYIHNVNNCTLTRCSQPKPGVRGTRSVQDEKLVATIFSSHTQSGSTNPFVGDQSVIFAGNDEVIEENGTNASPKSKIYGAQQINLIIDARPLVNAVAQQAVGAGSENMDHYSFACKEYLGIDNIHVMRKSLQNVVEAIKDSDLTSFPCNKEALNKSNWLKHISGLLEGTNIITRRVAIEHSHVLIHCSDGWDRTSQLSALAQICLDPYYRTLDGFIVLVEKDWLSFGHKFLDRGGYLSSEKWFSQPSEGGSNAGVTGLEQAFGAAKMFFNSQSFSKGVDDDDIEQEGESPKRKSAKHNVTDVKETSPVFLQYLDGIYQLMRQHPTRFEYNERFLRRVLYHLYSCQYGNFLYNNDKERQAANVEKRTRSVWGFFLSRRKDWMNLNYNPDRDRDERGLGGRVIFPDSKQVRWWSDMFCRPDAEMNSRRSPGTMADNEEEKKESTFPKEKTFTKIPDQQGTLRDSPTVVIEDANGEISTEPDYVSTVSNVRDLEPFSPIGSSSTSQGAAVLGTEKAAVMADVVIRSTETLVDSSTTAPRAIPGTKSRIQVDLHPSDNEISQSYDDVIFEAPSEPPVDDVPTLSFDNDQDTTSVSFPNAPASFPQQTERPTDHNYVVLSDNDQDPLGGHTAVDLDLTAFSPRTRNLGFGRVVASRSRSRGSSNADDGNGAEQPVEQLEEKRKSFEEMEIE